MKKILVTGAGGFVGARAMVSFGQEYTLTAFPKGMLPGADEEAVMDFVRREAPAGIIHAAAISDMEECEKHPRESYRANVLLTKWLCSAAKETGAKIACFSSDQVYNGCQGTGPFAEGDEVTPVNLYGRQKVEAEKEGLAILPSAVMLRATWMYDLPGYGWQSKGNLLTNLIRAAAENRPIRFSTNDFRGITYVRQVASLLAQALDLPGGIYNYGSENDRSMYDTAVYFLCEMGLSERVRGIALPDDTRPPRGLRMRCDKLRNQGVVFDDTCAGIRRCLVDYGLR